MLNLVEKYTAEAVEATERMASSPSSTSSSPPPSSWPSARLWTAFGDAPVRPSCNDIVDSI